ncbi:cell division protein SepF [Candidatus Marsarchaeota archaeon]|nr:cell division protein SepF [Candidatus Marsarchaeota archaeon]MCL5405022.1 cell division protein SepF [Candidatus Marsarchaeota archaeon]
MGIFDRMGKGLGTSKELNVEDYMNSEEMENVDVLNEPADFYIKPVTLKSEDDIALIEAELSKKNIILLNVSEMSSRVNTLNGLVSTLKEYVGKIDGDIAQIDKEKIILAPSRVKIIKSKKPASKS